MERYLLPGRPGWVEKNSPSPKACGAVIHQAGGLAYLAHLDRIGRKDRQRGLLVARWRRRGWTAWRPGTPPMTGSGRPWRTAWRRNGGCCAAAAATSTGTGNPTAWGRAWGSSLCRLPGPKNRRTKIRKTPLARPCLKIEKRLKFSQETDSCKEESGEILCVFRALTTMQMLFLAEKDGLFDFSNKAQARDAGFVLFLERSVLLLRVGGGPPGGSPGL